MRSMLSVDASYTNRRRVDIIFDKQCVQLDLSANLPESDTTLLVTYGQLLGVGRDGNG